MVKPVICEPKCKAYFHSEFIIDSEAGAIIYLVASIHLSVCPSIHLSVNALTAEYVW